MQFVKSINSFKDLAIDEFGNAWFLKYLRNRYDIQLTYILKADFQSLHF
jgi:hypothetical protein